MTPQQVEEEIRKAKDTVDLPAIENKAATLMALGTRSTSRPVNEIVIYPLEELLRIEADNIKAFTDLK